MPNDIKAFLTKKVGPLPMGVWIGTAAVGLYVLHKRNQSAAAATQTTDPTIDPATGVSYADEAAQAAADQQFPSSSPPPYLGSGSQDLSGAYGALPPINVFVTPQTVPGSSAPAGGLTAHQLHLLHLQHIGNGPTPKKALSAHQLHLLHLQHVANRGA